MEALKFFQVHWFSWLKNYGVVMGILFGWCAFVNPDVPILKHCGHAVMGLGMMCLGAVAWNKSNWLNSALELQHVATSWHSLSFVGVGSRKWDECGQTPLQWWALDLAGREYLRTFTQMSLYLSPSLSSLWYVQICSNLIKQRIQFSVTFVCARPTAISCLRTSKI